MKYMKLGNTEIDVSILSLGTWGMGGGTSWQGSDDDESIKVIHRAKDLGINLIDTAPVYGTGHSEEVLGRALKGRRSEYILSTKCTLNWRSDKGDKQYDRDGKTVYRCFEPQALRADLEDSLKRMGTDYIDIYITHRQPDELSSVAEIYGVLDECKRQGKIRAIGISNASQAFLEAYLKCGPVELVQEKFSFLEAAGKMEYLSFCEKNKVVFQAFSVLERGLLAGKIGMDYELKKGEARNSISWMAAGKRGHVLKMLNKWKDLCAKYNCSAANLVIAYTARYSSQLNVLFGASRLESLEDTVRSMDIKLQQDDIERMKIDIANTLQACVNT